MAGTFASVVGRDDHHGVIDHSGFFKSLENFSDGVVEARHHGVVFGRSPAVVVARMVRAVKYDGSELRTHSLEIFACPGCGGLWYCLLEMAERQCVNEMLYAVPFCEERNVGFRMLEARKLENGREDAVGFYGICWLVEFRRF